MTCLGVRRDNRKKAVWSCQTQIIFCNRQKFNSNLVHNRRFFFLCQELEQCLENGDKTINNVFSYSFS